MRISLLSTMKRRHSCAYTDQLGRIHSSRPARSPIRSILFRRPVPQRGFRKLRAPWVIVLSVENNDRDTIVMVVPVTNQQPRSGRGSVEIPAQVQAHLGLRGGRCWVVIDEVKKFVWPGPDLAQIPGPPGKFHYGFTPPKLYKKIIAGCTDIAKAHRLRSVTRTV